MSEFLVKSFKYGLDTRREQLTSQPGTLVQCQDCHINPGGEIEKRKQFGLDQTLAILDSNADAGTFGLEATSVGLVVFGSAIVNPAGYVTTAALSLVHVNGGVGINGKVNITAINGIVTAVAINTAGTGYAVNDYETVTTSQGVGALFRISTIGGGGSITGIVLVRGYSLNQPVLVSAMPAGYTYQQLVHPTVTDSPTLFGAYSDPTFGGTRYGMLTADVVVYDRTLHRITAIPFSHNYNGNSFVAATFADGRTFLYYNGTVIRNSSDGVVPTGFTTNAGIIKYLAYRLEQQILAVSGYMADGSSGGSLGTMVPEFISVSGNAKVVPVATPASTTMSLTASYVTAGTGVFDALTYAASVVASVGGSAASFTVAGGAGNRYIITAPLSTDASSTSNLVQTTGTPWGTSNNATATAIAAEINLYTGIHGYTAGAVGAIVTVTAPVPTSVALGYFSAGNLIVTSADATANGTHAFSSSYYHAAINQQGRLLVDQNWAAGDTYTLEVGGTNTFTVGLGNIGNQTYVCGLKLGQRMFVGFGSTFAFSGVNLVTGWEEQNTGAGTVKFLNQFGAQDTVKAFAHLQGRMAVFGSQSIQMWTVASSPANFALAQTLDNSGTVATFSVQSLGDYDVYYLDATGVRSLRAKEVTNNAFVDDIGTAVDLAVRADLVSLDTSTVCSVIEPTTRQYWLYLNGKIYVLSNYPTSKILAWSTYLPTYQATDLARIKNNAGATVRFFVGDSNDYTKYSAASGPVGQYFDVIAGGTQNITLPAKFVMVALPGEAPVGAGIVSIPDYFSGEIQYNFPDIAFVYNQLSLTPIKFVVYNGRVYCRASDGKVYLYGGAANNSYDNTQAVVEMPWLDDGAPNLNKQAQALAVAMKGNWAVYGNMQPQSATSFTRVVNRGSTTSPNIVVDSTYDVGSFRFNASGTHFKFRAVSGRAATSAKLAQLSFIYNAAQTK